MRFSFCTKEEKRYTLANKEEEIYLGGIPPKTCHLIPIFFG